MPLDFGAISMTWRLVPSDQLLEPDLTLDDFFRVLSGVKPSVSELETDSYHRWTREFGLEGA